MRIVLPPSETKTPGGKPGSMVDWDSLACPEVTDTRRQIASDLIALCADRDAAAKALGLGVQGLGNIDDNSQVLSSPVMPAIERYTGVVFDALDYTSLDEASAKRADATVGLFSALFGPLRATDLIPRYRLSFDSKLPGEPLKARWSVHREDIFAGGFTIDMRSEGYRALAPLPEGVGVFVKIVKNLDGAAAAGHANKAAKGRLVRALVESGVQLSSAAEVLDWLQHEKFQAAMSPADAEEVLLALD